MTLIEQQPTLTGSESGERYKSDADTQNPRSAIVAAWLKKIERAEDKWSEKFDEMRKNMEFVAGWQWEGQKTLNDERYISNVTQKMVNNKVASLYAKNPQVEITRRERMNYQVWDGERESMVEAITQAQQALMMGQQAPYEAMVLLQDYETGRAREKFVDKVCKTLSLTYQYQVDAHRPEFKEQMKQLVRRVVICKVGYVKLRLCSAQQDAMSISTVSEDSNAQTRIARAQAILDELQEGEISEDSAEVEEAKGLLLAAGASHVVDEAPTSEYLEFDFPTSTSIIPSEECRSLKEFISAKFVAHKFTVDSDLVKSVFGVELGTDALNKVESNHTTNDEIQGTSKKVVIYEVFDIKTKTRFFVGKGYKDYILEPEPVTPCISGFWPIFGLTFNDVESDEDTKSSPFPPSDVDLLRNPQKEWNRTRNALRDQRNASAPKYVVADGMISEEDEQALENARPNSVTKLKSLPPGVEPDKFIKLMQLAGIDPALYDTGPLEKDMLLAGGMQEANAGLAGRDVTATVGTIAEQSRMTMLASNVDDLDGFLSRLAKAGVEMILRGMSLQTVQQIVGPGGVIPQDDIDDYLNEINVKIAAASSGRPNRAMGIANAQQLAPLLLQAGANPEAIVEELVKRLDDTLDIEKFFPLTPTAMTMPAQPPVSRLAGGQQKSAAGQRTISHGQGASGVMEQQQPVTAQG